MTRTLSSPMFLPKLTLVLTKTTLPAMFWMWQNWISSCKVAAYTCLGKPNHSRMTTLSLSPPPTHTTTALHQALLGRWLTSHSIWVILHNWMKENLYNSYYCCWFFSYVILQLLCNIYTFATSCWLMHFYLRWIIASGLGYVYFDK